MTSEKAIIERKILIEVWEIRLVHAAIIRKKPFVLTLCFSFEYKKYHILPNFFLRLKNAIAKIINPTELVINNVLVI